MFSCLCLPASCAAEPNTAPAGLLEPVGVTYDTFVATKETFLTVSTYAGYVVCHTEPLYFTRGGLPVKSVEVQIGARVKEGDPLVTLNTESIEEDIAYLEESIEDSRTRNGFSVKSKELDIQIAALELAEARRTGDEDSILRSEYNYDRLSLEYEQLLETQEQELARRLNQLNDLREQLKDTIIYAPFDGRVIAINTSVYGWPQAYRPVMHIADETRLEVLYSGREYLGGSRNSKVTARISGRAYDAKFIEIPNDLYMKYVISGATPPSRFEILEPDALLAPGRFVGINVITREVPDALVVPVNSIYRGESEEGSYNSYVYVIENGQKILRVVQLGPSNDSYYIVLDGLEEGEEVFVKQ